MGGVIQWPDKRLSQVSEPVGREFIPAYEGLIKNLTKQVEKLGALGLSAIQLGVPVRIAVIKYGDDTVTLINPVIIKDSGKRIYSAPEGCMSVDNGKVRLLVRRYKQCKVAYMDTDGALVTIKGAGTTARLLQHELDHMDGVTIMERR